MTYRARVTAAGAPEADVRRLLVRTDEVAGTVRAGTPVRLEAVDVAIVA